MPILTGLKLSKKTQNRHFALTAHFQACHREQAWGTVLEKRSQLRVCRRLRQCTIQDWHRAHTPELPRVMRPFWVPFPDPFMLLLSSEEDKAPDPPAQHSQS